MYYTVVGAIQVLMGDTLTIRQPLDSEGMGVESKHPDNGVFGRYGAYRLLSCCFVHIIFNAVV